MLLTKLMAKTTTTHGRRTLMTGLVGLPNVGKSSLFNALTSTVDGAEAANYPFCTIDPNKGIASVADPTLDTLATVVGSKKVIPAVLEFLDIAGLVEGASKGEGLGNKFLGNIRECDAIIHVVRCFEDEDIIHVSQSVDPVRDIAIINIELALSDLEQVENKLSKGKKKLSANEQAVLHTIQDALSEGLPARSLEQDLTKEEALFVQSLHLLTMKPQIYAANVDDESLKEGNVFSQTLMDHIHDHSGQQDSMVLCSAKFESELVGIDNDEERAEYLEMCGLSAAETGLNRLAKSSYDLLRLSKWGGNWWVGGVGDVWEMFGSD